MKDINYYINCFCRLSRNSRGGEKAPHKIILLLAVIDRVEYLVNMGDKGLRMIDQHLIDLNPCVEKFFYLNWHKYVESDVFTPSFSTPFFHMEMEPFWHLQLKKGSEDPSSQNEASLYRCYVGAKIDDELMNILCDKDNRQLLRSKLIDLINHVPLISLKEDSVPYTYKANEDLTCRNAGKITKRKHKRGNYSWLENNKVYEQYRLFLTEHGSAPSTINKYSRSTPNSENVQNIIFQIVGTRYLYDVDSVEKLKTILDIVKKSDFDITGDKMYSNGISHYIEYLQTINQQH